jgi:hypothetical protein
VPESPPGADFQTEPWSDGADATEQETVPTSPADVESAGRSCMAIVILAAVIIILLCLWIGLRAAGIEH